MEPEQGFGREGNRLQAGPGVDAGFHRRSGRRRSCRDAGRDEKPRRRSAKDQSARAGGSRHRSFRDRRRLRQWSGAGQERRTRIPAQRRAIPVPEMGAGRIFELPGGSSRHRHLPSGQSRIPGADDLDPHGRRWRSIELAYPDTLVGTDSHTTMVNGLAVLGWGVGGIEAEAVMLGQQISMLLPQVDRLQADRPAQGRRHGDRSRADRDADAAQAGRGRKIRRVLRSGAR